jgi:PAS domain S-box-containing protein
MKDNNKTKKQLVYELTELRSQNAALKKSESAEKYQSLVENIRDVIYELDSQGVVLYISPAIRDMLGYDSAEIVGKNFIDFGHKDDLSSRAEWFSELRKGRESPSEYRVLNKSGALRWARTRTRPIMEDGLFKGGRGILIDVTDQKLAEEALHESEEKYRSVFENSVMGISQALPDGRLINVNSACAEIYGYANAEEMMVELSSVEQLYANTEERKEVLRILTEKGVMEPREIAVVRRNGTRFTVLAGAREIKDSNGNLLYYQAEHIDITDRKQAEEGIHASLREKEILLRELHHRVKNNMQVISGLLDLQARSSGNPELTEMLNKSQSRIRSMALVHEQLYSSKDLARIDMVGYVRALSQELFQAYKIDPGKIDLIVQTDGDVCVDISKATPCGLILNELVSNALKHAFPGDGPGELRIIIHETKNKEIEIIVRDNGFGLPDGVDIHQPRSMGLYLVNGLVKKQLEGQIEVRRDNGTEFRIKFPL